MDSQTQEIVFFVIIATGAILLAVILVVNLLLLSRNRRLKHESLVLELKNKYEKELMKTQVEVAENTLNDIARDLHDDVGQMLTFSIIQLNNIKTEDNKIIENNLSEVRNSIKNTLQSVREISKTLSNDYISSFGIYESLQRLFERLERQKILSSKLNFSSSILFKSRSNELFVFRIIQELVSNTIKHSQAMEMSLSLFQENNNLKIEYRDNGKGISPELLNSNQLPNSLGFANIYKRIELMKGMIEINSNVGEGFYLQLTIPNE